MASVIDKVAWLRVENGRVLSTRSVGKEVFYIPGGKPEADEDDIATLVREIHEELSVHLVVGSATYVGTFEAQAHGYEPGVRVRMPCYSADYVGELRPANEIDELDWLTYADRSRVPPVDQLIFDHLKADGLLH